MYGFVRFLFCTLGDLHYMPDVVLLVFIIRLTGSHESVSPNLKYIKNKKEDNFIYCFYCFSLL